MEEYEALISTFVNNFKTKNIYHWWPQESAAGEFDGLLLRGDKNPNTNGLKAAFEKHGINTKWSDLEQSLKSGKIKQLVVIGPENTPVYKDIDKKIELFAQAPHLIYVSSVKVAALENCSTLKMATIIPMKSYIEKDGTFVNYKGLAQKFKKATIVVSEALTGTEFALLLAGQNLKIEIVSAKDLLNAESNTRKDQVTLDHRKKNEFIFNRGRL